MIEIFNGADEDEIMTMTWHLTGTDVGTGEGGSVLLLLLGGGGSCAYGRRRLRDGGNGGWRGASTGYKVQSTK